MMIFGMVFILMVLVILGMAIGVLAGRKSLQGSCGGLNTFKGLDCMVCPTPCEPEDEPKGACPHAVRTSHFMTPSPKDLTEVHSPMCSNQHTPSAKPLTIGGIPCN